MPDTDYYYNRRFHGEKFVTWELSYDNGPFHIVKKAGNIYNRPSRAELNQPGVIVACDPFISQADWVRFFDVLPVDGRLCNTCAKVKEHPQFEEFMKDDNTAICPHCLKRVPISEMQNRIFWIGCNECAMTKQLRLKI